MLASSAHLTRTAQHNNPVDNFKIADDLSDTKITFHKEGDGDHIMIENQEIPPDFITCKGCEKQ